MEALYTIIKIIPVLIAAILLGRWFQSELNRVARNKEPLYRAYLSWPGLIILTAVLAAPILLWLRSR